MRRLIFIFSLFIFSIASGQVTPLQQIHMMKAFKPSLQKVGILCELSKYQGLTEKLQRAAFSSGVKVVIGDVKELKDVASRFGELVKQGVEFIWILDENDLAASPIARDFIFKNALVNKIPVAVPSVEFVKEGALYSMQISGEEIKIFVNGKVANALQINIPENYKERVQYVAN